MPEALITDSMIAKQLKVTEKALNRDRVALTNHESMVQSPSIVETLGSLTIFTSPKPMQHRK